MKNRLLLLISLVTTFGSAHYGRAQSYSYTGPPGGVSSHFGLKAGPALTRLSVDGITSNQPRNKFDLNLGVMYRLRLKRFVFQPEALLATKGGLFSIPPLPGSGQTENSVQRNRYVYLSVPVLLGVIPTEGLTIQAGPEFSYALNAGDENGPGQPRDLGVAVGAHYDFLDLLDKFSLHVRYVHGLSNVSSNPLVTYRNRALQVAIVYNLYPKPKAKK